MLRAFFGPGASLVWDSGSLLLKSLARFWSAAVVACGMLVSALIAPRAVFAGGGPENVFVVANSRSWASLTIAHHFAALRELPATNVLYLDWPYSTDKVDVE